MMYECRYPNGGKKLAHIARPPLFDLTLCQEAIFLIHKADEDLACLCVSARRQTKRTTAWNFIEFLSDNNVPVLDYEEDELSREFETVEKLGERLKKA